MDGVLNHQANAYLKRKLINYNFKSCTETHRRQGSKDKPNLILVGTIE